MKFSTVIEATALFAGLCSAQNKATVTLPAQPSGTGASPGQDPNERNRWLQTTDFTVLNEDTCNRANKEIGDLLPPTGAVAWTTQKGGSWWYNGPAASDKYSQDTTQWTLYCQTGRTTTSQFVEGLRYVYCANGAEGNGGLTAQYPPVWQDGKCTINNDLPTTNNFNFKRNCGCTHKPANPPQGADIVSGGDGSAAAGSGGG